MFHNTLVVWIALLGLCACDSESELSAATDAGTRAAATHDASTRDASTHDASTRDAAPQLPVQDSDLPSCVRRGEPLNLRGCLTSDDMEHIGETIELPVTVTATVTVSTVERSPVPGSATPADVAVRVNFAETSLRIQARQVEVLMCGVRAELLRAFEKAGLTEQLGEGNLFPAQAVRQTSTLLAIRHAYARIPEPCAHCPRRDPSKRDQDLYYAV